MGMIIFLSSTVSPLAWLKITPTMISLLSISIHTSCTQASRMYVTEPRFRQLGLLVHVFEHMLGQRTGCACISHVAFLYQPTSPRQNNFSRRWSTIEGVLRYTTRCDSPRVDRRRRHIDSAREDNHAPPVVVSELTQPHAH